MAAAGLVRFSAPQRIIAVPALLHLLEEFPSIQTLTVMVQAEVAERLAAEPGGKEYGVPSVKMRFYGRVRTT